MLSGAIMAIPHQEQSNPELCAFVVREHHLPILGLFERIVPMLSSATITHALPNSIAELLPLLFSKLQDECRHLMLRETGIIFPCVQKMSQDANTLCVHEQVLEHIKHTHQLMIQLLQKQRQLLHHYVTQPAWPADVKACINDLFLLETTMLRWIHFEQSALYPQLSTPIKSFR